MLNKYLDIAPEVKAALDAGKPVVALESTIISHVAYPPNVGPALNVEKLIRDNGAVPATIAVIKGRLKAGLSEAEIDCPGAKIFFHSQGQPPGSAGAGGTGPRRRLHRYHHHDYRQPRGHQGLCYRRHRRRAPGRRNLHGRLRRSGRAGPYARYGHLRGRQIHSGSGTDAGVSGNSWRSRHWLRHGGTARVLHPQIRRQGGL